MWIAEQLLFQGARALSRTEIAHSSEMKTALESIDALGVYRASEIRKVSEAAGRYSIPIVDSVVLDFGSNDGALSAEYLQRGATRVIGVDVDQGAIKRAQSRHQDDRLVFIHSDVGAIPLPDQCVDASVSCDVFEHVSKPAVILKELHRVLRPGGKVLIGTWSWWHPFAPHLWATMPVPWAHIFFSEKTVLRVCRRVYNSSWYSPKWYDYDSNGQRLPDKYLDESISTDYLNKYLIRDFERAFVEAGFDFVTHAIPFGSNYAAWTRPFARLPWFREFMSGYVWFVLTRPRDRTA